ncbi:MAG: hypothetical protein AB9836_13040 [Aminipila sp.]
MFVEENDWNPRIEQLRKYIKSAKTFDKAIELSIALHEKVHFSEMSNSKTYTYMDEIWDCLDVEQFAIMPSEKNDTIKYKKTIAYHVWHTSRIEDLVANILINGSDEVLNDRWLNELNINVRETGNTMSNNQIEEFSRRINLDNLRIYRNAVGFRTTEILKSLSADDIKKKPRKEDLDRLLEVGGLVDKRTSIWLKDFWGKKTFAGLILLPILRHHILHLNDCKKLKEEMNGKQQ